MSQRPITTNEELVIDLMNWSPYGGLCQVFIMQAIQHYVEACIKEGPDAFDSPLISGSTWVGIAQDVKARCDAFYGRHNQALPDEDYGNHDGS